MLRKKKRRNIQSVFLSPATSFLFGVSLILASPFLMYLNFSFSAPSAYSSTLLFTFVVSIGLVCSLWPLFRDVEPNLHSVSMKKFLRTRGITLLAALGSLVFLESWLIFSVLTSGVGAILYPEVGSSIYLASLLVCFILMIPTLKATRVNRIGFFWPLSVIWLFLVMAFSVLESVAIEQTLVLNIHPYFSGISEVNLLLLLGLVSGAGCVLFFLLTPKNSNEAVVNVVEDRGQRGSFSLYNFMFFFGIANLFTILFFDFIFPLRYNSVNANSKVLVFLPGDLLQNVGLILSFLGSIALVALGSIKGMTRLGANLADGTFGFVLLFVGIRGLSLSLGSLATNFSLTSIALNGGQQLFNIIFGAVLAANSVAGGIPILSTTLALKPYARQQRLDSVDAIGNDVEQS